MFGLDQLGRPSIDRAFTTLLIGSGALLCAFAFIHLRRTAEPMLDLSLFRIQTFALPTLFAGTGFRIVIGATPFLWPLLFQVGFGLSAFVSGSLILACAAGDLGMKFFSLRLLRRFGFRQTLIVNGLLFGVSILACAAFSASTPDIVIVAVLFMVGVFRSVQFGTFNVMTFVDVPLEQMSSASSLASTIQQMGFGLGVAFGALALHLAALSTGSRTQHFTVADFHVAFIAAAVLAGAAAFGFIPLHPNAGSLVRNAPARVQP
jgi:hypothetical protein